MLRHRRTDGQKSSPLNAFLSYFVSNAELLLPFMQQMLFGRFSFHVKDCSSVQTLTAVSFWPTAWTLLFRSVRVYRITSQNSIVSKYSESFTERSEQPCEVRVAAANLSGTVCFDVMLCIRYNREDVGSKLIRNVDTQCTVSNSRRLESTGII